MSVDETVKVGGGLRTKFINHKGHEVTRRCER
jgi:hypothetical protein